ncbi:MAG: patatin-like phospholipase family protein [Bryobacteraceae bacterium]|nr:patatin-like phospholipase family protein [Bryobacteraceae bacterium]
MRALVLSAGGMFGAWQAGAWSALEEIVRPEIVVGASVGSLNAWLIACGAAAPELVEYWRGLDATLRPSWRMPRRGLGGLVDATPIQTRIQSMCEGRQPRLRLGVVAVATSPPRPVLFEGAEVTWRHLAASCSVPLIMAPVLLDGTRYVDGGALGPLPLWAAGKMGATRAVAIDVLSPRPLALRVPQAILRSVSRHDYMPPPGMAWKTVAPKQLLGGWKEASRWDAERVSRWIEEGRREGFRVAEEVRALMESPAPERLHPA